MIVRIVKMHLRPDAVGTFLAIFEKHQEAIRNFRGCEKVDLWQDIHNPAILMTCSYWTDEEALEEYRKSPLFSSIWPSVKMLFTAKAEAWSLSNPSVL